MKQYLHYSDNTRNNEKLIALRMKYGWEGYGLYCAIIEKLSEASGYNLSTDYSLIAYDLIADIILIRNIVCDFGLFVVEEGFFYSEILNEAVQLKEAKSRKARESARARWNRVASRENAEDKQYENVKSKKRVITGKCFIPPTQKDVEAYCAGRKNGIDASLFINYYEARGWMAGRNKMKCWQAAIRMWEKNKTKTETNDKLQDASTRIHPALQ